MYVDDVVVERAIKRQPVGRPLLPEEKAAVAREMAAKGMTAANVASVLKCAQDVARRLMADG